MKKFIAALLVLTMVFTLATTAMAACKFEPGDLAELKKDANSYSEAKSGKKTKNVAKEGSVVEVVKECGDYVKVIVNHDAGTTVYFKKDVLKHYNGVWTEAYVIWAKGGKGMSTCQKDTIIFNSAIKGFYVKVTGHTNLRKNPGLKCKSQGVVEKGDLLKLTGRVGFDDRHVLWVEVCKSGKKLWLSMHFVKCRADGRFKYYDKDGNCAEPIFE